MGYYRRDHRYYGYIYSSETFASIDAPKANRWGTIAQGVNNAGEVVGYFQNRRGFHGFVEKDGVFTQIDNPRATNGTYAYGINNNGVTVGEYGAGGAFHSFAYANGVSQGSMFQRRQIHT